MTPAAQARPSTATSVANMELGHIIKHPPNLNRTECRLIVWKTQAGPGQKQRPTPLCFMFAVKKWFVSVLKPLEKTT
ncbi:hypothetical protein PBY51_024871 [Eleginops maclovinus]|uniref:Uncharacterized protein n=1 Tax=Eleginops maclovinus TaxID=56733 RepID=A0AAN7XZH5_ELEMC|nr:hypothetical protein PBY51_024871 [Eleginops maclovinus]